MPRCPAHCPPSNSGPPLPAVIIAGAFIIAAAWTVIVHVLTILVITLGVAAGLGVAGLAAVIALRLRDIAREPRAPGRHLQARAGAPRTIRAAAVDQRQITTTRAPAADYPQGREPGYRPAAAIEQHWHLHLHGATEEQPGRLLGQAPGRMPDAREGSPAPSEGGGHHDA
jgi:hypothetical protein